MPPVKKQQHVVQDFGRKRMDETLYNIMYLVMSHPEYADLSQGEREDISLLLKSNKLEPQKSK